MILGGKSRELRLMSMIPSFVAVRPLFNFIFEFFFLSYILKVQGPKSVCVCMCVCVCVCLSVCLCVCPDFEPLDCSRVT